MLAKLVSQKLASATVIETVIALLILMISFSAGMSITGGITEAGVSDLALRADAEIEFIADSLAGSNQREETMRIQKPDQLIEIGYEGDSLHTGVILMKITSTAQNGKLLAKTERIIKNHEQKN